MRILDSEIDIAAPAARVWEVLTDFEAYPEWNPFIRGVVGELDEGERLIVTIQPPGRRPMTFRPVVRRLEPERELRWLGRLWVPGLFDGEHSFRLEPLDPARGRFRQGESFRGLLVPLLGGILRDTERGFHEMNRALKARAERA